mgnify:FL=1
MLLIVILLVGCGDSTEEEHGVLEEEMDTGQTTEAEESEEADWEEDEENIQEDNDSIDITVLGQAEVTSTVDDLEVTNFTDLDEQKKAYIDDSELTEERIYYGNEEVIALNNRKTLLYDLSEDKVVWESGKSIWQDDSHIEEDKVYFSNSKEFLSLDISTGEIVDEYPFIDFFESFIKVNENYITGLERAAFQITNRETGEKIPVPLPEEEYYPSVLAENALVIEEDGKIISYDLATGKQLAELEKEGDSSIVRASGNGDDLYVFVSPIELNYGYIVQKMDATTFEIENEVNLENANLLPVVTTNAIYYYDAIEGHIVAVDLSLERELWRYDLEGDDRPYQLTTMIGDENGLHIMLGVSDFSRSVYLNLGHENGEIHNFVELNRGFHDNSNEFYTADGKAYIRVTTDGENIFHVIDKENAHREFPSKDE